MKSAPLTKNEFAEYLKEQGFNALVDEGCVLIVTEDKKDLDQLEKLVKEKGFIGTRGWRDTNYGKLQTTD